MHADCQKRRGFAMFHSNAQMTPKYVRNFSKPDESGLKLLETAIDFWAKNFREKLNQLRTQEPATFLYY